MDNQRYYVRNGALSYELDQEHTDHGLTHTEMQQISLSLEGVRNAVHLCCGAGRHVAAFERVGIPSIGIDISPDLLKMGRTGMGDGSPKALCMVLGDALIAPIRNHSADCVTLLGNSICLFSERQCEQMLSEVERILVSKGVFIMDLPDPAYLHEQCTAPKKTSQTISTQTLGDIHWTWIRHADPVKHLLVSEEFIRAKESRDKGLTRRLRFEFRLYDPEQACSLTKAHNMHTERVFQCEDTSGRYKGMLRKRTFLIMRTL